jgi:SAM-dependent methyltransferase
MIGLRQLAAALLFWFGQMAQRAARLTDYLAIGTRQLSDMRDDSLRTWQAFYERHRSHDARLLPWEIDFADRFLRPGDKVLLIGCGSGRDLLPLAVRHCAVTGIDPVRSSLDIARRMLAERGLTASLIEGFFEDASIAGTFDAVIFSYYCYSVIPESRTRVAMLRKAATVLSAGGHIVISVGSNTPRPHRILVRMGQLSAALCGSDWRLEPGDLVWNNREGRPSYSYTHAFEPGEIEREASTAGLTVVFQRQAEDNTIVTVVARP